MSFSQRTVLSTLLFVSIVIGHSQMRCAKYNKATGACDAPIRGTGYAFMQEAYDLTSGGGICQYPFVKPISSYYSNGASCYDWAPCPAPMGNYTPGEQFTIMWFARNHAVSNQSPGNVHLYLAPITQNQGSDVSKAVMQQNLICSAPYMSCGGVNQDQTPCTMTCTFPSVSAGLYTMMWLWDWTGHDQYSTCADIMVLNGATPVPSIPSTTGKSSPATTGSASTTGLRASITTGKIAPLTTGKVASPSTTGKVASPSTTGKVASPLTTRKLAIPMTTGKSASATTGAKASVPSSTSTPSSSDCTVGHRKCATSETYYTCSNGRSATYWAGPQSCQQGTTCHPEGDQIYCY